MAEFSYFWTKHEMFNFITSAFNAGYEVQVIKHLNTPVPAICRSISSIEEAINQAEYAFLLTRNDISHYPVHIKSFIRDGVTLWTPRTRVGGPCIEIYSADLYEKEGKHIVPCSTLAYHGQILHPETDEFEPAGDEIKKVFNAMIAPLRKKAKKVKSIKRTAYVSPGVEALLNEGYVLAKPFGMEN